MSWFKRNKAGINTATENKKEAPDGMWNKCPSCKKPLLNLEQIENNYVCQYCGYHIRIGSAAYFSILFDDNAFTELFPNLTAGDPLHFVDSKPYSERLVESQAKTGLKDALRTAHGKMDGRDIVIACMDFNFIGGSMGSVVGEKIARSIDYCIEHKLPFMLISKSGGARMMEAAFSLMQMAKTSAAVKRHSNAGLFYITVLTDPTTGGVTASFASLGDIILAEPQSLIGFAGRRVIEQTVRQTLPDDFQKAEFLLNHGFVDAIVKRTELRQKLALLLELHTEVENV